MVINGLEALEILGPMQSNMVQNIALLKTLNFAIFGDVGLHRAIFRPLLSRKFHDPSFHKK